jgi:hypothetical protein
MASKISASMEHLFDEIHVDDTHNTTDPDSTGDEIDDLASNMPGSFPNGGFHPWCETVPPTATSSIISLESGVILASVSAHSEQDESTQANDVYHEEEAFEVDQASGADEVNLECELRTIRERLVECEAREMELQWTSTGKHREIIVVQSQLAEAEYRLLEQMKSPIYREVQEQELRVLQLEGRLWNVRAERDQLRTAQDEAEDRNRRLKTEERNMEQAILEDLEMQNENTSQVAQEDTGLAIAEAVDNMTEEPKKDNQVDDVNHSLEHEVRSESVELEDEEYGEEQEEEEEEEEGKGGEYTDTSRLEESQNALYIMRLTSQYEEQREQVQQLHRMNNMLERDINRHYATGHAAGYSAGVAEGRRYEVTYVKDKRRRAEPENRAFRTIKHYNNNF